MKAWKHILIVIALLIAAAPHAHAAAHAGHNHHADGADHLCAHHPRACHSCDSTPCSDAFESPQAPTFSCIAVIPRPPSAPLFEPPNDEPVVLRPPLLPAEPLMRLRTVQLLI